MIKAILGLAIITSILLYNFSLYRMEQNLSVLGLYILSFWLSAVKENFISGSGVNLSLTEMHRYVTILKLH